MDKEKGHATNFAPKVSHIVMVLDDKKVDDENGMEEDIGED